MGAADLLWVIVALPFLGATANGFSPAVGAVAPTGMVATLTRPLPSLGPDLMGMRSRSACPPLGNMPT